MFIAVRISEERRDQLIVWNTGQGQWVTLIDHRGCWHFDAGGERAPWAKIIRACRERRNFASFSHWDWDHISFAARLRTALPEICVLYPPTGPAAPRKMRMLKRLSRCQLAAPFQSWVHEAGRTANDRSRVVWWRGVLIPGDSTSGEEKYWIEAFSHLRETRVLVLGHHGSQTSTSRRLLNSVPYTRVAIASSRRERYGHPHFRVRRDLREYRIPLLVTEDWGSIAVEL